MTPRRNIVYVTSSSYKHDEIELISAHGQFVDGANVGSIFNIDVRSVSIPERLEFDLSQMVKHEVGAAYEIIKVPCIVEHAGLIFEGFEDVSYPGALTKPMWNSLGTRFVDETNSRGRRAIAKAVVGYCDGMTTELFTGATMGRLADSPRGSRTFYWDTIFIPDNPAGGQGEFTYAEIVDTPTLGLRHKVIQLSQSTKAMLTCLHHIRVTPQNRLWA